MPVTGLPNDSDWLASLMQNMGAGQPYGAAAAPPTGGGPGGLMPGGGAMGYQAATPGAPSMGYPAMGQPQAGVQPAGAQPGVSLASNPLTQAAQGGFHNIQAYLAAHMPSFASPAAAAPGGDPRLGYSLTPGESARPQWDMNMPYPGQIDPRGYFGPSSGQSPASAATAQPSRPVTPTPGGPAPVGDYVSRVGNQPSWPTTAGVGAPQGSPSATPRPATSGRPTPNLGRYPAFTTIDAPNANPQNSMRRGPQMGALDLSALFRRG